MMSSIPTFDNDKNDEKKIIKNIKNEFEKTSKSLRKFDKKIFNEIGNHQRKIGKLGIDLNSEDNTNYDPKLVENNFSTSEKFKKFKKNIASTAKKIKPTTKSNKLVLGGVVYNLQYAEKDHGEKYWNYLNNNKDIKEPIIGKSKNDKKDASVQNKPNSENMIKYIKNQIVQQKKEESTQNIGTEEDSISELSPVNDNAKSSSNNSSESPPKKVNVSELIDNLKKLQGEYNAKFEEKQGEIDKLCRADIDTLRRFGIFINIPENKNFLVTLNNKIIGESGILYPTTDYPADENKKTDTSAPSDNVAATTKNQDTIETEKDTQKIENNGANIPFGPTPAYNLSELINEFNNQTNDVGKKLTTGNTDKNDTIKNKIIQHYEDELHLKHEELKKEFIQKQQDIFKSLGEKFTLYDENDKSVKNADLEKYKENFDSIETSLYNFNISTGDFKNKLDSATNSESSEPSKSTSTDSQEPSTGSDESSKDKPGEGDDTTELKDIPAGNDDTTEEIEKPEWSDLSRVLIGRMYQSDFLQKIGEALMDLYKYMPEDNEEPEGSDKSSYSKKDIKNLILCSAPEGDFNLYNLRKLYQKENNTDYMKSLGIDDEKTINDLNKEYFYGKEKDYKHDKKSKDLDGDYSSLKKMFQYTRAYLRAYICIKYDAKIDPYGGTKEIFTTDSDNLKSYRDFLKEFGNTQPNETTLRNKCTEVLERIKNDIKNDIKNKKKFEHLSKCLGEATNGKYYFDHLKQAMTNDMHKEKVPAGSVEKMLTENGWLYQGESTTEGNIDFKKIKKLLNSKK